MTRTIDNERHKSTNTMNIQMNNSTFQQLCTGVQKVCLQHQRFCRIQLLFQLQTVRINLHSMVAAVLSAIMSASLRLSVCLPVPVTTIHTFSCVWRLSDRYLLLMPGETSHTVHWATYHPHCPWKKVINSDYYVRSNRNICIKSSQLQTKIKIISTTSYT